MSLSKTISLTVNDYDIKLSSNIKFYQNDQLKLKFEINEYGINVENGVKVRASMPVTPLSAILFIETPLGVDSIESAVIENNTVTFYLSSTQTQHVGISRMQIQLSDKDGCQVTLPPFQFEIRENIYDGEVVLNQVLLADEDNNIIVDENGNGLNIGTQVSSQTYAVALSADETKTATTSIPTKQIQDYDLKIGVKGTEDLLIQDNGITKRIKTSELMDSVTIDISIYYTKEEINTLLENKADASHTHVVADIADLSIPIIDVDKAYVDAQLLTKANVNDIPSLDGYATETYVQNKIAEVDLSSYATKNDLNTKADNTHTHVMTDITDLVIPDIDVDKNYVDTQLATKANITDIPTKVSELTNDSGYLTVIPEEYVTDTELESKGYLTEHQDISNLATKAEVQTKADVNHIHSQYLTTIPTEYITETELADALSTKANTSDIPSLEGYATETYVTNKIAEASLSGGEVDLSGYATKDELTVGLAKKSNVEHIHSYNDLTNKPTIPSVEGLASTEYVDNAVSNITIDTSNLATKDELNTKANISDIPDLTGYALKTEIPSVPTNTSELVNDSGFLTSVPNEYITETELSAKGYLVSSDIVGKANISDLSSVATTGDYNDLLNKPNVTNGKDGENGATFTPNVDTDGNLSWTNDKELENPTTINIKGAKGDKGEQGEKGADGKDGQDGLTTSISLNGTVYSHVDGTITLPDYPTIPTKTSDLINDSEFLTSIPTEYITEAKLNEKGYLTEHQDISGKANISDLSAVATSGNYNDLINTPTIPNEYILPIASATTLGGIKVGSGLSIDTNGVLSATGTGGTGTGGTAGNGIIFNDSYIADCNRWLSNGYVKTGTSTLNLPTLCTGVDKWGILFFIAENATNGTGTQMYFPVDGTYKGRIFTRSLTAMNMNGQASEWVLLTIQSDIPTLLSQLTNDSGFVVTSDLSAVATSGNYNDLINKPTIPSIDGLATETYVNNKIIPRLVGNTVVDKTLTLTVDKYQYAVLSNGDSINLPSVSSFTEIHLFFKADTDLTITFPSVSWQSIPSITSGHTYEIIFTYVVDKWLAGVICYG